MIMQHTIYGLPENFSPSQPSREEWLEAVTNATTHKSIGLYCQAKRLIVPRVAFTTRIALPKDAEMEVYRPSEGNLPEILRTKEPADGMLIPFNPEIAVGICNADCPIVVIYDYKKMAVLHGGYRCLMREDKNALGILEEAMKSFDPARTCVDIFGGVGDCCYAFDYPEGKDPSLIRHPTILSEALSRTKADHTWQDRRCSVDLFLIAKRILQGCGVQKKNMIVTTTCTCCATEQGRYTYWSHTRTKAKGGPDGRNLALVWCFDDRPLTGGQNPQWALDIE